MPLNLTPESVATIVTAIVGIYIAVSTRRKNLSDAVEAISNAAQTIVETNSERIKELLDNDRHREDYINYLLNGIGRLHTQLRKLKQVPSFSPKTYLIYKKPPNN